MHSWTGHAPLRSMLLMFLNFVTTLSENRFRRLSACGRELNDSFELIREPIHWFANWFDQAFQSQSQSLLYCQFCHMYLTYIQRIEIVLLSYSLVHTDNTKH